MGQGDLNIMKYDEKLEHFKSVIMDGVNKKRSLILHETQEVYEQEYNKKETEYLTRAYEIIQNGLKKIDKEKNEIISKTVMNNKMALLNKRNEVIQSVFENAKIKLKNFGKSEEYKAYLFDLMEENVNVIGQGTIKVILNHTDEQFVEEVKEKFKCDVEVESKKIELIGGCKIYNLTSNTFVDDTFVKRLESQRENFLKECKIDVGM